MKTKRIPFDIERAKNGAKVVTRDGRKVRIVCCDRVGKQPIIALIGEKESPIFYYADGSYYGGHKESVLDLFIEQKVITIQALFDINKAKAGAKIVTRNGMPAKIIFYNRRGKYPIVALIDWEGYDGEIVITYTKSGEKLEHSVSDYDLFIEEEI